MAEWISKIIIIMYVHTYVHMHSAYVHYMEMEEVANGTRQAKLIGYTSETFAE